MAWLGDLLIRLKAETADFQQDMGKAAVVADRTARQINNALGSIGIGISAVGFVTLVKGALDAAEELGKLSQKVAISAESLSKLKLAAELGDVSVEGFGKGLREFNRTLVEAQDNTTKAARLMKALGVDITAGPERAFRQFVDAFSKLPESELRTAVAMEVLKKSGADWIPVLAAGTRGLDEAADKAERLGLVITSGFTKQAEQFNDNLKLLKKNVDALAISLSKNMVDGLGHITSMLVEANQKGTLLGQTFLEIAKFLAVLASRFPKWTEIGQMGDRLAEFLFIEEERQRSRRGGPNLWPGATQPAAPTTAAPNPAAVAGALANPDSTAEARMKRQIAAIQQMEERKRSLFNLSEEEITLHRVLEGTYKDFDAATKVRLLNLALELDARKQHIDAIEKGLPAMQAEFDAQERAGELLREHHLQGVANAAQMEHEFSLIGKTADEQARLNLIRQHELDLLRRKRELAQTFGEDQVGLAKAVEQLEKQAAAQRDTALKGLDAQIAKEREWSTGAEQAFRTYVDHATNAAEQARTLFTNAFRSMEDALVNFVRTGKLDFKSLADSIISDIIRIEIRAQMAKVLKGDEGGFGLGSILGSIGSFFGGGSGFTSGFSGVAELPFLAEGGPISGPAIVGEEGPELFVPRVPGTVVPNHALGGGTYYIDARGADSAAVARLEQRLMALHGSVERRSVAADIDAARRGVRR